MDKIADTADKGISTKNIFITVIGVIGSTIANLLGGWDSGLTILCIFIAADLFTGHMVAAIFKKSPKTDTGALDSRVGWKGIAKKIMTLVYVLMGTQLDKLLGVDYIRNGVIIASIVNEGMSIIENGGLMGMPLMPQLSSAFDILRKTKGDDNK